jgi:DNA-binding NtrC family response regulator
MTKKQILFVDDMGNWRQVIVTLLQNKYELTLATNYNEALTILRERGNDFALAILDVRLEDQETFNVQGVKLLRLIRENYPNTHVIMLTGYPESVREKIKEYYKPNAFLSKVPLDIEELTNTIDKLVESRKSNE